MDKDCVIVQINKDLLTIGPGPVAFPPEVFVEDTTVSEFGDLPKGVYKYNVTSVGVNGESSSCQDIIVYARYEDNAIVLRWKPIPFINEYRVYRSSQEGPDGYFTVFSMDGYFCDDGRGVLNQASMLPPARTKEVNYPRSIHRAAVKGITSEYLGGMDMGPNMAYVYIELHSGEIISINIGKVVNQPWISTYQGLLRAVRTLEKWVDGNYEGA